ncbi:MAG: hypothetical protein JNK50_01065 [Bacteroidia bacterium]|nr:hypothetical protein [Bacteroidia bacterium]
MSTKPRFPAQSTDGSSPLFIGSGGGKQLKSTFNDSSSSVVVKSFR